MLIEKLKVLFHTFCTNISGLIFCRYGVVFYGICTNKAYTNCEFKRFKNIFMPLKVPIPCNIKRWNTRCNCFTITAITVRFSWRLFCTIEKNFIGFLLTNPLKSHRGTGVLRMVSTTVSSGCF